MTEKKKPDQPAAEESVTDTGPVSLSKIMSKQPDFKSFRMWLIGDTPLITHAWSTKAKTEMLQKQIKATKAGKAARDPEQDFVDSLYKMGKDKYGFPVTGVKNAILSSAHKDKGIARSQVMGALYLHAEMVRVGPALAGAICDLPLVRIYGSDPEMREDMVRIGTGMTKTANLAYRAQFTVWAMRIMGRFNSTVLTPEALSFLVAEAGTAYGIGEWRTEKKGVFGAFHLANMEEELLWEDFASGEGPLPVPAHYQKAAE